MSYGVQKNREIAGMNTPTFICFLPLNQTRIELLLLLALNQLQIKTLAKAFQTILLNPFCDLCFCDRKIHHFTGTVIFLPKRLL